MDINLHIERLILDGLPIERNKASHIQVAVEAELTRLITQSGLAGSLQAGSVMANLCANEIRIAPRSNPRRMGTQIARSVYSGIGNKQ